MQINFSFDKEFECKWNELEQKYPELLEIEGLKREQLDFTELMASFYNQQAVIADQSIDSNSNICSRNVTNIKREVSKPYFKLNFLYMMWRKLRKLYNLDIANEFLENQIIGKIYCNDAYELLSYCYNFSTFDIATNGLAYEEKIISIAPKHLKSFLQQVINFIAFAGNQILGAIGVADIWIVLSIYVDKMLRECGDSHVEFKDEEQVWNYVREEISKFIYNVNQSLRQDQSPFTNVSIYDKYFLEKLCPDYKIPDIGEAKPEIVDKVQKIFIDVMNEELQRTPVTFPVCTICFSVDENNNIKDKEFLDYVAEKNLPFAFMNMYFGDTSTLSSCCFHRDTSVIVKVNGLIYKLPFYHVENLIERCKNKGEDVKIEVPGMRGWKEAELIKIKYDKDYLIEIVFESGTRVYCTPDHKWPIYNVANDILIEKYASQVQKGDFVFCRDDESWKSYYDRVFEVKKRDRNYFEDKIEYVYCFKISDKEVNENGKSRFFYLGNGLYTSNCRLRSEIKGEFQNSFGAGSSKIGSVGVVTINLPRLAYETKDKDKFKEELKKFVYFTGMVNNVRRMIVKRRIELGTLPLYTLGYIDLKKQYSTTGITGLNEALEILGLDILSEEGQKYVINLMKDINECLNEMDKLYGFWHNVEQVPGESSCVKLAEKDRILGYNDKYDLYSNQFIPLWKNCDIFDRIMVQGKFDKWFSGGSILHLNVEQKIKDKETMKSLIESCARSGCIYFAVNYLLGYCENCKVFRPINKLNSDCEICSRKLDTYQRVVGFLTNSKYWHRVRREKELPKRVHYGIS